MFIVFVLAALAFTVVEPIQVLPRIRLAPGYAFVDQHDELFSSESARGSVAVYAFSVAEPDQRGECLGRCAEVDDVMNALADAVEGEGFAEVETKLITIAVDTTTPEDLVAAADDSGADGSLWRWVGSSDQGTIERVVKTGFRHPYEVAADGTIDQEVGYRIVDGAGIVRGEYRYQSDADASAELLIEHLEILADEVKYSSGAAQVAYEAAHLFLCYP